LTDPDTARAPSGSNAPVSPRAPLVASLVALLLACTGCPARRPASVPPDAAALAALDTSLAAWLPLEPGPTTRIQAAWNDGQAVPLQFQRAVERWELLGGAPWARSSVVLDHPTRRDVFLVEWLRPAGDRILCARRQVGSTVLDLDPPQPVLVAPITSGTTWAWAGRVGGVEARATFEVTAVDAAPAEGASGAAGLTGPIARVVQTTTVDGLSCTSARVYALGVGVIDEQGTFPVGEAGMAEDRMRAFRVEPAVREEARPGRR
jgi:hypothetical protein